MMAGLCSLMWCIITVLVSITHSTHAGIGSIKDVLSNTEHGIENGVQHIVRAAGPAAVERLSDETKLLSNQTKQLLLSAKQLVAGSGCVCVEYNCGCCAHVYVPEIHLDHTVCVNVSYLPQEYGFRATMNIDKWVILNVTMSAKNPPPICIAIPYLKEEASVCVDFYNLDVTDKLFSGCVRFEAKFLHIIVSKVELGCFHIPIKNLQHATMSEKMIADLKIAQIRMADKMVADLKPAQLHN